MRLNKITSETGFHEQVQDYADSRGITFYDALLDFCDRNDIDIEDAIEQLDEVALQKLRNEALNARKLRPSYTKKQSASIESFFS